MYTNLTKEEKLKVKNRKKGSKVSIIGFTHGFNREEYNPTPENSKRYTIDFNIGFKSGYPANYLLGWNTSTNPTLLDASLLHIAARWNNIDLLLDTLNNNGNANIDKTTTDDRSPLYVADSFENKLISKILLEKGAKPYIEKIKVSSS